MLQAITIHNFALIHNLSLELESGLNVLTGETGAGKSIIIDALGVALGGRASSEYVRSGANSARVEVAFSLPPDHPVFQVLEAQGLGTGEEELVLGREIHIQGRNLSRVNGHLVTTQQLRSIAQYLVDIHGQHSHQSLLNAATHLAYLDALGDENHHKLLAENKRLFQEYSYLKRVLNDLEHSARERAQQIDILQFQINEISAAGLKAGEWEDLMAEKEVLTNREKLLNIVATAYNALYGNGGERGALDLLGESLTALNEGQSIDKRLAELENTVASALYTLEEVLPALRHYQESFPWDEKELDYVEERLDLIRNLSRKYGATIQDILAFRDQAACALEEIMGTEQNSSALREELKSVTKKLCQCSTLLSTARRKLAADLEIALQQELSELGMPKAMVRVDFSWKETKDGLPFGQTTVDPSPTGFDQVELLLTANEGEPPRPLAKIASGGELSRVMLALKTILAAHDSVPTLIFDEVDSGIGGKTAQAVAKKLVSVSRFHQVICVTHLPQIAAVGDTHFQISKETQAGKTFTRLKKLTMDERKEELGRMLSGQNVTPVVLQHASELLTQADRLKEEITKGA
ncbi:MAG: DNA repair protein RecN [bacterium]